ncbi:16S rRNA (adenine(1518)-N(6)/adenine(1519)-N(6))-dimethyltransferase RsmA [Francisellaceae bacterium]|nr:16S rRNA (adenine(1518)-N(6)/adenine(1519)-N(6))-dimethyltransferase RsmA [Francisellaceae bacterium]
MSKHRAKKHLGQNFLHDPHIIENIIRQINIKTDDTLVEVGPGLGALTTQILPITQKLNVIEYDTDVIPTLKENCEALGELIIHHQDALKFDFEALAQNLESKIRLVGNLPYNISSPLIFHFIKHIDSIADMHFMLQKEVVERICSGPGSKSYGRLSIMIQYFCKTEALFVVPPEAFTPAPKVDSQIIRLTPHQTKQTTAQNFERFADIVRSAFSQRRKTLRNTLKAHANIEQLEKAGIDPSARAETIPLEKFVVLSNLLEA